MDLITPSFYKNISSSSVYLSKYGLNGTEDNKKSNPLTEALVSIHNSCYKFNKGNPSGKNHDVNFGYSFCNHSLHNDNQPNRTRNKRRTIRINSPDAERIEPIKECYKYIGKGKLGVKRKIPCTNPIGDDVHLVPPSLQKNKAPPQLVSPVQHHQKIGRMILILRKYMTFPALMNETIYLYRKLLAKKE